MIDPRLLKDIQLSELCKLTAYKDSEGLWTIGWGHELFPQTPMCFGITWTQAQADTTLSTDIMSAQQFAARLPEWSALDTDCRRNAVVELCFEMRNRWLAFKNTRAAIQAGDWKGAHDGLLNSLWASEVHATRAGRLADYLLAGEYP